MSNLDNAGYNDLAAAQNEFDAIFEQSEREENELSEALEEMLTDSEEVAEVFEQNASVFAVAFTSGGFTKDVDTLLRYYFTKILAVRR